MSKELRSLIENIKKNQAAPPVEPEPFLPPSVKTAAEPFLPTVVAVEPPVNMPKMGEKTEKLLKRVGEKPQNQIIEVNQTVVETAAAVIKASETEIDTYIKVESATESTPQSGFEMPSETKVEVFVEPQAEAKMPKPKPSAKAKIVVEPSDFDTFFAQLNEGDFQLEQKTVANIDNRFYDIFMILKRKKKVKNISIIVNAILKEFVERHKDEIRKVVSENSLT